MWVGNGAVGWSWSRAALGTKGALLLLRPAGRGAAPMVSEHTDALPSVPGLKAEGLEPAGYGKGHGAFQEVQSYDDGCADSKGFGFPEEVQSFGFPAAARSLMLLEEGTTFSLVFYTFSYSLGVKQRSEGELLTRTL